ncbi:MAG: c-type cytochrome [Gemmatimonadaceae bacterium]
MLRTQLPCLGCHTLAGDGGVIGPDLTTVRERRSSAYIGAMVNDPQRVVPGSAMPRTAMTPALRDLIVSYLTSLPTGRPAPDAAPPTPNAVASPADGAGLYQRWCASCHGASGRGDGPNASHLPVRPAVHASRDAMSLRSDDALYDTIAGGGLIMNRSARMPAFGATLSDAQIRTLVAYIRSLCGCQGPAWSRDGATPKP